MKSPSVGKVSVGNASVKDIDLRTQKQREEEFKSVDDLTANADAEIGIQLQKIREFEQKFKDEWKFDGDAGYYFTVCFRSKEDRDNFINSHNITLRHDNHVMIEDIQDKFKEA